MPAEHVEVGDSEQIGNGFASQSRFANDFATSTYNSPGWQRAQANRSRFDPSDPPTIQSRAETVVSNMSDSRYERGERIFHQKFGYGRIEAIEGNKLTVGFEKAGRKKVLDAYVEKH